MKRFIISSLIVSMIVVSMLCLIFLNNSCASRSANMAAGLAAAQAVTITHGSTTINMDFVTVGNPGNAADTHGDGYGAVSYTYNIGKYEVTKNQWDAVVGANTTDLLDDPGSWSGDQPVASISWHDAAMFCNWLTSGDVTLGAYTINDSGEVTGIDRASAVGTYGTAYVLPTEDEWYKAAYYDPSKPGGAGYWDYSTKHDEPSVPDGIDSSGDTEFDAVFPDGYDQAQPNVDGVLPDGYNQGQPNDVDNAGVLSAYGTMGQSGNVLEWNENLIGSSWRGVRGGYWWVYYHNQRALRAIDRYNRPPTQEGDYLGFRVASIPGAR